MRVSAEINPGAIRQDPADILDVSGRWPLRDQRDTARRHRVECALVGWPQGRSCRCMRSATREGASLFHLNRLGNSRREVPTQRRERMLCVSYRTLDHLPVQQQRRSSDCVAGGNRSLARNGRIQAQFQDAARWPFSARYQVAISSRLGNHTWDLLLTYSMNSRSAAIRCGWPMTCGCSPTFMMRPVVAPSA